MILNLVFFLINILILAVIYLLLRRRIDRLTDTRRISDTLAGDLDVILSEINQATERNVLIIEDKISELEEIISTAEKRITLLKKSINPENRVPLVGNKKNPDPSPAPVHEEHDRNTGNQLSLEIPDRGESGDSNAELTYSHLNKMRSMSGMVTPMKVPEKKPAESESIKEKVIRLYRSGIDPSIIASNVGINRGEAELIISLYMQTGHGREDNG